MNMKEDLEGLYRNAEDIMSAASIVYEICSEANDEIAVKIRPVAELIYRKADKVCIEIMGLNEG